MQIINSCARLITINFDGKKYPLMPAGNAVEIPDEARKESKFLQALLKDGSVRVVESDDDGDSGSGDDPLEELRQEAKDLGVEGVTKRWGEAKLREAIEEAKKDADDGDSGSGEGNGE